MRKLPLLLIITALMPAIIHAQVASSIADSIKMASKSVYKNLTVKKFYKVNMTADISSNGPSVYKINDKPVSRLTYNRYLSFWENMETCKPCVLKAYDENDVLLSESVQYTDCPMGYYITYYSNGKIEMTGYYKDYSGNDWTNIYNKGYCRQHGTFTYYDINGQVIKVEHYTNGVLDN